MTNDEEYAAMLAGGNASIGMHDLGARMESAELSASMIQNVIKESVWRALRQTFDQKLGVKLPASCPDLFDDGESHDG